MSGVDRLVRRRPDNSLARGIVRQEARRYRREDYEAAFDDMHAVDAFIVNERIRPRRKMGEDEILRLCARLCEIARAHPNVLLTDSADLSVSRLSKKSAGEVFTALLAFSEEFGTYEVRAHHRRLDRKSMSVALSRAPMEITQHAAIRLLQRGSGSGDALRRLAEGLIAGAGALALSARLWEALAPAGEAPRAALPLEGGLLLGRLMLDGGEGVRPSQFVLPRSGERGRLASSSFMASCCPGATESPPVLSFVALTYIGPEDMNDWNYEAGEAMAAWQARHPVLRLVGLQMVWPASPSAKAAVDNSRAEIAEAYRDLVEVHRENCMRRLFRVNFFPKVPPPLPWDATALEPDPSFHDFGRAWRTPRAMRRLGGNMEAQPGAERLRSVPATPTVLLPPQSSDPERFRPEGTLVSPRFW